MLASSIDIDDYPKAYAFCQQLHLALIKLDIFNVIVDINELGCRLYHKPKQQLIGKPYEDVCRSAGVTSPFCSDTTSMINTQHENEHNETIEVAWTSTRYYSNLNEAGILLIGNVYNATRLTNNIKRKLAKQEAFNNVCAAVYCKDLQGTYLESNPYLNSIAANSNKPLYGLDDYSTAWHATADELREDDRSVTASNDTFIFREKVLTAQGQNVVMLSTKQPLHDSAGNIVGITGCSMNISDNLQKEYTQETAQKQVQTRNSTSTKITPRELDVIQWLIKGKSASETATILNISEHTVQGHIDNIKQKLNCHKQFRLGYMLGKYGDILIS